MKTIEVVAAVIIENNKVFATQRGCGEFKGGWEFPGGKIEAGETAEDALVREIKEELDADIIVGDCLRKVEYDYPTFHLSMCCYLCKLKSDKVILKEHKAAIWLEKNKLDTIEWLPADLDVVSDIYKML